MITRRSTRRYRRLQGRDSANPFEDFPVEGFSMRVVRLEAGRRRSPHRHPHSQEAIYVASGRGVLWEDGVEHQVEEGDCVVVEAGVPHATIPASGTTMELVCFLPSADLESNIQELEHIVITGGEREGTAHE